MERLLVLVRHGQSEWNLKNLFTGWRDVDLSPQGVDEAKQAGQRLKAKGFAFDVCFTSALIRAQHTLDLMLTELGQEGLPITRDQALNERDYGDLVGLNKDDARKKWGEEQVHVWRRSYAVAPPNGESLRDTGARVWPYYINRIQPHVLRGEKVLIAAHIGRPTAARAVGTAVGRNPISFVVPCHRVLGKDGSLHGYHWGLTRKQAILGWEAGVSGKSADEVVAKGS